MQTNKAKQQKQNGAEPNTKQDPRERVCLIYCRSRSLSLHTHKVETLFFSAWLCGTGGHSSCTRSPVSTRTQSSGRSLYTYNNNERKALYPMPCMAVMCSIATFAHCTRTYGLGLSQMGARISCVCGVSALLIPGRLCVHTRAPFDSFFGRVRFTRGVIFVGGVFELFVQYRCVHNSFGHNKSQRDQQFEMAPSNAGNVIDTNVNIY